MERIPDNFKDLPPDEQDRILNDKLAALQARFEGHHTSLDHLSNSEGDQLTSYEERHRAQINSAMEGVIDGIRDWRSKIKGDLASGYDADTKQNPYEAPRVKAKASGGFRVTTIVIIAMLVLLAAACIALGYVAWLIQRLA